LRHEKALIVKLVSAYCFITFSYEEVNALLWVFLFLSRGLKMRFTTSQIVVMMCWWYMGVWYAMALLEK
jgi:hypothetical protein